MRRVGFHVSIEDGLPRAVERALERECTAFQIFCGNPRGWTLQEREAEEVKRFREERQSAGLCPLFVHSCYLINACSSSRSVHRRSVGRLAGELALSARIGAEFYVLHPGSHKGRPAEWGIERATGALAEALDRADAAPTVLLESMASPHGPGGDLSRLAALIERVGELREGCALGVALDSCHVFGAGYDLREPAEVDRLVDDVDAGIGLDALGLIHVNDSRDEPGSKRDRHTHIGEGTIGERGFRNLLNHPALRQAPLILETPWESVETDLRNLRAVLGLLD